MSEAEPKKRDLDTLAVHGGEPRPPLGGAVCHPVFHSTTYLSDDDRGYDDILYQRLSNTPSHEAAAAKVAALEGTEAAVLTASGMAAITTTAFAHLEAGDHALTQDVLYGGSRTFFEHVAPKHGIDATFVPADDPDAWRAALTPKTRLFHVESITNPLLEVGRLDEVTAFCREHGLVSTIDNTFPTPVNFRPVELGFDFALHSATKYLGGHSDVTAGAVAGSRDGVERVRHALNHLGGSLGPFACTLLHRGLKTLPLRVRAQNAGALALARFLDEHPAVTHVHYPGLQADPSHDRVRRWFDGAGGMVTFIPGGGLDAALRMFERLEIPLVAPSLGGVETLVCRPAVTSHAGQDPETRRAMGIPDEMVRISVGVESATDLIADFDQALGSTS